jgi:hypothetical protein
MKISTAKNTGTLRFYTWWVSMCLILIYLRAQKILISSVLCLAIIKSVNLNIWTKINSSNSK